MYVNINISFYLNIKILKIFKIFKIASMRGTTASFAGMRGSGGLGLMKSSSGLGASTVRNDLQFRG